VKARRASPERFVQGQEMVRPLLHSMRRARNGSACGGGRGRGDDGL